MPQNMETSVGEGLSLSASSAHHSGPNVYVCGTETNYCRASSIESGDGVFFFLREPQDRAAATAITPRSLAAPPVSAVVATSFYNLLARIFREVGCSRIASLWWDQGTGVDPTQPITLTLTLSLTLTRTRTKTGQKRARNAGTPLSD